MRISQHVMAEKKLTPKQAQFVAEYLIDLNATQAAIRCGYSAKTANREGSRLLSNVDIAEAIAKANQSRTESTNITAQRVLKEIAAMAYWDPADIVEIMVPLDELKEADADAALGASVKIDGKDYILTGITCPRDIKRLPEGIRRAIVGWGYDRNQNFTLKLADKSKALDQLGRHLSIFNDTLKVTGLDALADRLARAARRDSA